MNLEKENVKSSPAEEKINQFIKRRKDENSALKKLLSALENAKKEASVNQGFNTNLPIN
jgi:hypothetical protein